MIQNKHITKITAVLTVIAVAFCLCTVLYSEKIVSYFDDTPCEYETKLFDTSEMMTIDILMDQEQWNAMLEAAMDETYELCDVVINGETIRNVALRTKGNTSLTTIARDPNNDRYSFKIEFDKFVPNQSCFGLDKLILNNNFSDTTNMKETIIYDMFAFLDADASLYNYAKISVNGEYWGTYLALEAVEESFLTRNYGIESGYLYKPDGMVMGAFGPNGGSKFNGGANLNYTNDNPTSYDTIWKSAINNSTDVDHKRVVTALKNIHSATDIEKYMDTDNILRYMAVHNFAVNDDSLSGIMTHNYYLYEQDGKLNIIPWDYNLSFGGMGGGNSTQIINEPIDDSYNSTDFFDVLLENEAYREKYHEYYRKLIEEYVFGGEFDKTYNHIKTQIDDLIKADPNAMYTYEEYETGSKVLYDTVKLRAESIKGQLDGTIPTTTDAQKNAPSSLIDASSIDISQMGQFMGGGFVGNSEEREQGNPPQRNDMPNFPQGEMPPPNGEFPNMNEFNPENFGGRNRENFSPGGLPGMNGQTQEGAAAKNFIYYGTYIGLVLVAIIFVKLYKRKRY